ncbi:hypothetical protein RBSH_04917 [Rhodopirellula baltica SH28]|uniref:Uncharacterized protein n=1 Tax=Rhodopirellula baltica SH28 TaxID=993517 RepID=K5DAK7_RHOBT|nr:hypothetical protein RBSH_04917 [Rhodopirellula baltica SH28]
MRRLGQLRPLVHVDNPLNQAEGDLAGFGNGTRVLERPWIQLG